MDEIGILSPNNTEEAYQSAIKAEEKINRRLKERTRSQQRESPTLWQRLDC